MFVKNNIKYLPSSRLGIKLKRTIDFFGYSFFNRNKDNIKIDLKSINSIAIVNLGHIGDLLLMLPMLDALRESFDVKIILVVNSYTYELAVKFKMVDSVHSIPHPIFSRSTSSSWFATLRAFRKIEADIVFDAGVYFFSIPFAYLCRKKYFIGYNPCGFGFLFDVVLDYPFDKHITEKYYKFLDLLNIRRPRIKNLMEYLNIPDFTNEKNYIVIAVGTGAQARDWGDENYIALIDLLINSKNLDKKIILLGKIEPKRLKKYETKIDSKVVNLINKTSIIEAISVIRNSSLFIGLESGLTHAAALLGIKTIALYSGTAGVGVWDPINYNGNVEIIRFRTPCDNNGYGCGKKYCQNNICMKLITPELVFQRVNEYLKYHK